MPIRLLDADRDAADVIKAVVGADLVRAIGPLKRTDAKQVRPDDLKITVTYWGGGKGRWIPRAFRAEELPAVEFGDAWGENRRKAGQEFTASDFHASTSFFSERGRSESQSWPTVIRFLVADKKGQLYLNTDPREDRFFSLRSS